MECEQQFVIVRTTENKTIKHNEQIELVWVQI